MAAFSKAATLLLANQENCIMVEAPLEKAMHLLVESITAIPCPAVLDDMFEDAGVGLIWIPQSTSQQPGKLRDWSAVDIEHIDKLVHVAGRLIAAEMQRSGYPIIQRQFDSGASIVVYRRDQAEEARKLCGIVALQ